MPVVFKGKFLADLKEANILYPNDLTKKWIAQCQSVGKGEPALKYLARYLYRGIISEDNILDVKNDMVSLRYKDSQTQRWKIRKKRSSNFCG